MNGFYIIYIQILVCGYRHGTDTKSMDLDTVHFIRILKPFIRLVGHKIFTVYTPLIAMKEIKTHVNRPCLELLICSFCYFISH
jgi:hypothetical protein